MRRHRNRSVAALAGLGLLAGLSGCETVGSVTAPRYSKQQQEHMARQAAVEFEKENELWKDPLLEAYVRGIVQRLDRGIPADKKYPWSVRIVNSSAVNAFTYGGGLIYVYAGLVARMENEAQFATVLAHEMAHSTEEHIARGLKAQHGVVTAGKLAGSVLSGVAGGLTGRGVPTSWVDAVAGVTSLGLQAASSGLSRGHEREADEVGLVYLVEGDYDPREAPRTFVKLHELYGDPPLADTFFYADHPSNVQRFEYLTSANETRYADVVASRDLVVNTEEYKRRTRSIVIEVGKLDYQEKRFMTSKEMMNKALGAYDEDPVPHYWLSRIALDAEGDPEAAIAHLRKAIGLRRDYADAHRELGTAYYMSGDRKEAIASYERYLKLAPDAKDRGEIAASIEELGRY